MTAFVSSLGPGDPQLIANGLDAGVFLRGRSRSTSICASRRSCISSPTFPYDEARATSMSCSPAQKSRARLKHEADDE